MHECCYHAELVGWCLRQNLAGGWWHIPSVSAIGRQRQGNLLSLKPAWSIQRNPVSITTPLPLQKKRQDLTILPRVASNSCSSWLSFPHTEIPGKPHIGRLHKYSWCWQCCGWDSVTDVHTLGTPTHPTFQTKHTLNVLWKPHSSQPTGKLPSLSNTASSA